MTYQPHWHSGLLTVQILRAITRVKESLGQLGQEEEKRRCHFGIKTVLDAEAEPSKYKWFDAIMHCLELDNALSSIILLFHFLSRHLEMNVLCNINHKSVHVNYYIYIKHRQFFIMGRLLNPRFVNIDVEFIPSM